MKKLFLVLGLVTVLLASCCNNNQQGAKCNKAEQKCEQKCEGHNHDHQNCEIKQACTKQCDSIKPCEQKCEKPCEQKCEKPCEQKCETPCEQKCEKPCEQKCDKPCEKAQNCEVKAECPHNHKGCQHQHGAEK